jgi:hypothetical protein
VSEVARFPYTSRSNSGAMPMIPVTLQSRGGVFHTAFGLLDTGASISVLPNAIAVSLGLVWQDFAAYPVRLGGVFRGRNGRFVKLKVEVGSLPMQEVVFGWLQDDDAPLILGNANFFDVFDACFSRSNNEISIRLAKNG